jgi:maleate isomerase
MNESSAAKRVGLLVPSSDITLECELYRNLPAGIELHVTRMPLGKVTRESLARMAEESAKALTLIMDAEPHLIVYGCTSGSFIGGKGYDSKVEERITKLTGVRSITVAHAVVDALKALGVQTISVCTPYIEEINLVEKRFLTESGFEVKSIHGMNIVNDIDIGKLDPQEVYSFASGHDDPHADAMFISCTNVKTLAIILSLRRMLGKPIVSSNLATLWTICKYLNGKMDAPIFDDLRYASS